MDKKGSCLSSDYSSLIRSLSHAQNLVPNKSVKIKERLSVEFGYMLQ